jgi:hypothetical protein
MGTVAPARHAPPMNDPAILQAEKLHLDKFALSNLQLRRDACSKLHATGRGGGVRAASRLLPYTVHHLPCTR